MKLTRQEIVLLIALAAALVIGGFVKQFREAHPAPLPAERPISKK